MSFVLKGVGCGPQSTGSAGDVVGGLVDFVTSRPVAIGIAGVLTYLLIKSPTARKELFGTAKGEYGRVKARFSKDKMSSQPAKFRLPSPK